MKKLALLALAASLSGCNNLPKDSLIRNASIVTPWGTSTIELAATGKAAEFLSQEERKEFIAPSSSSANRAKTAK